MIPSYRAPMLHDRTPEEYPPNLGLVRPDMLRADLDKEAIILQANQCHEKHGFVQLLTFWGIGWKPTAKESDRLGMAHLALIAAHLQMTLRKGTRLTLLLGDNHACANEVPEDIICSYSDSIRNLATEFGFTVCPLSLVYPLICDQVEQLKLTSEENAVYAPERPHYEKSARHLQKEHFERRARHYFLVRYREKDAIAKKFPDAILASPDIHKRAALTPPLPTFYIYALPTAQHRKSKPWFLMNY